MFTKFLLHKSRLKVIQYQSVKFILINMSVLYMCSASWAMWSIQAWRRLGTEWWVLWSTNRPTMWSHPTPCSCGLCHATGHWTLPQLCHFRTFSLVSHTYCTQHYANLFGFKVNRHCVDTMVAGGLGKRVLHQMSNYEHYLSNQASFF